VSDILEVFGGIDRKIVFLEENFELLVDAKEFNVYHTLLTCYLCEFEHQRLLQQDLHHITKKIDDFTRENYF